MEISSKKTPFRSHLLAEIFKKGLSLGNRNHVIEEGEEIKVIVARLKLSLARFCNKSQHEDETSLDCLLNLLFRRRSKKT